MYTVNHKSKPQYFKKITWSTISQFFSRNSATTVAQSANKFCTNSANVLLTLTVQEFWQEVQLSQRMPIVLYL